MDRCRLSLEIDFILTRHQKLFVFSHPLARFRIVFVVGMVILIINENSPGDFPRLVAISPLRHADVLRLAILTLDFGAFKRGSPVTIARCLGSDGVAVVVLAGVVVGSRSVLVGRSPVTGLTISAPSLLGLC